MKTQNKHAISLIVLVVTILVLAILTATVVISLHNENVINQAGNTVFKSDMVNFKDAYEMYVISKLADNSEYDRSELDVTYESDATLFEEVFGENVSDKYKNNLQIVAGKLVYVTEDEVEKEVLEDLGIATSATETPSTSTNVIGTEIENGRSKYIGYYVKIGDEYGIIFADLAHDRSDVWGSNEYSYSAVEDKTTLKEYVESDETKTTGFGTAPVLKVKEGTTGTKDRFYVMALSDFTTSENLTFCWYETLFGFADADNTALTFESGKQNTVEMIANWNADTDDAKNAMGRDMWGVIQQKVYGDDYIYDANETAKTISDVKWFVPSRDELGVFGAAFGISDYNYEGFGLNKWYWSSSLEDYDSAFGFNFDRETTRSERVNYKDLYVRLAATF